MPTEAPHGQQGPRNGPLLTGMVVGPGQSGGGGPGSRSLSDGCPGKDRVPPPARHWDLGQRFAVASAGLGLSGEGTASLQDYWGWWQM